MKNKIYKIAPDFFQNALISLFNKIQYSKRYGEKYYQYRKLVKENESLSLKQLKDFQKNKYIEFLKYSVQNSPYYKKKYSDIGEFQYLKNLKLLPIISKEELRNNLNDIYTVSKNKGIVSKTGGTTGKSLEVIFTKSDMQERFAMLDNFRSKLGYELGKKTAWFSGKSILSHRDVYKNRFWKTDYLHKVRYYSTFHIKESNLSYYLNNLIKYKPEYLIGFPSNIYEIARFGLKSNIEFPNGVIKSIFPTAETVTNNTRLIIERYFKTKMYDQYASSEGAPFIFECRKSNLHLELQSGVFEILDKNNKPVNKGRLIVTSFSTYGTPLIRYDIGDEIEISSETCTCGNNNPLVKQILGRIDDFIFSSENGKINLGNITNTLKEVKGVIKFQVIQNKINEIDINMIIDENLFTKKMKNLFLDNWRERVGDKMKVTIIIVNDITLEKSGKFQLIKNNIKHLIN